MSRLLDQINYIGNIGNRPDIREWREKTLAAYEELTAELAAARAEGERWKKQADWEGRLAVVAGNEASRLSALVELAAKWLKATDEFWQAAEMDTYNVCHKRLDEARDAFRAALAAGKGSDNA